MKLLCIFAAVLALAVAEEFQIPDSQAIASEDNYVKESGDSLEASASAYSYNPGNYVPQNSYNPPQNSYNPPQNSYNPPQNTWVPPQNTYVPPQNTYVPPQNNYVPPQNNYVPPQNSYVPPQNNYYPTYQPNKPYPAAPSSTTTPVPVIKNELTYGDNGSYQYEYQIGDGTHVGEQGYFLNPRTEDESLVKKGWYSYNGPDGKTYTVQWWADHTGFHATGDHLPTPPPIPPAIQAAIDQNAKEEAANQAAQNKPGQYPTYTEKPYYPTYTEKPNYPTQTQKPFYPTQSTFYPSQPTYHPNQPNYYPNQPNYQQQYYPKPTVTSYGKADIL